MAKDPTSDRRKLEAFYRSGRVSLEKHGKRMVYGKADSAAESANMGAQVLRDARAFARRVGSESEFRALIRQAEKARAMIGKTFVIALMAAPRGEWAKLIERAGYRRWSAKELGRQIRAQSASAPNRKTHRVGRKPAALGSQNLLRMALIQLCDRGLLLLGETDDPEGGRPALPAEIASDAEGARSVLRRIRSKLRPVENSSRETRKITDRRQ